jgi:hypothetical protein
MKNLAGQAAFAIVARRQEKNAWLVDLAGPDA